MAHGKDKKAGMPRKLSTNIKGNHLVCVGCEHSTMTSLSERHDSLGPRQVGPLGLV